MKGCLVFNISHKAGRILLVGLIALILGVFTLLVSSRRFARCVCGVAEFVFEGASSEQRTHLPEPVAGNRITLLVNGNEAYPAILNMISGARQTVRWQVMLFQPDEAGRAMAGALADAARRGVKVQLSFNIDQTVNGAIADGYSRERKEHQNRAMQALLSDLRAAGVEVRDNPAGVNFPPPGAGWQAAEILRDVQEHVCVSANHYDHRKLLIVDGNRALVGGMNVGNSYLYQVAPDIYQDMLAEARERREKGLPEPWEKWQDAVARIEGPVVYEMVAEFNWKWAVLGGQFIQSEPPGALDGGVSVQFLRQRPGLPQVGARFFDLVAGAQQEIYVASPFVSYDPAVEALSEASRRGVRVVFVYPHARQEMPLSRRIFLKSAHPLLESGVSLYFNDLRMAHTKIMVIDGRQVLLGSFNLNHRSFQHDFEIAAVVNDERFAREVVERVFQPYIDISHIQQKLPPGPWNPFDWIIKPFS